MPVAEPFEVAAVEMVDQKAGQFRPDVRAVRVIRQVPCFPRIVLHVEQLGAVVGGVIDEFEGSAADHATGHLVFIEFAVEMIAP